MTNRKGVGCIIAKPPSNPRRDLLNNFATKAMANAVEAIRHDKKYQDLNLKDPAVRKRKNSRIYQLKGLGYRQILEKFVEEGRCYYGSDVTADLERILFEKAKENTDLRNEFEITCAENIKLVDERDNCNEALDSKNLAVNEERKRCEALQKELQAKEEAFQQERQEKEEALQKERQAKEEATQERRKLEKDKEICHLLTSKVVKDIYISSVQNNGVNEPSTVNFSEISSSIPLPEQNDNNDISYRFCVIDESSQHVKDATDGNSSPCLSPERKSLTSPRLLQTPPIRIYCNIVVTPRGVGEASAVKDGPLPQHFALPETMFRAE